MPQAGAVQQQERGIFVYPAGGWRRAMFRARFKREIVAEFLPPARANKKRKVIILCDGMPSVPRKQPLKVMIFHAKDDPYIPWRSVNRFAKRTGSKMKMLARGGHLKTECTVQKYWPQIKQFFES